MKTIAITSPTSMIGSMLYSVLKTQYNLLLICKDEAQRNVLESTYGNVKEHEVRYFNVEDLMRDYIEGFSETQFGPRAMELFSAIGDVYAILNCTTVVKPYLLDNLPATYFINGALPHLLSNLFGRKLIHTSTDCVFSGLAGSPYTESSRTNPTDLYGMTRSLGEPQKHSLVIRTSIIGPEIEKGGNLVAWIKSQSGKRIHGFRKHLWNGLTSKQYAKIVASILQRRTEYPEKGVFHIFSTDTSKYDLITAIAQKYNIDVTVEPDDKTAVDRRLRSEYDVCQKLKIPPLQEQISEL